MRTLLLPLTALVFGLCPLASADEKKPAERPKPLTDTQAADAVLKAVEAKDGKALKALAEKDDPDPWLVADELVHRKAADAALAFAQAAPRPAVVKLPAWIGSRRSKPHEDATRRRHLAAAEAALAGDDPAEARRALRALASGGEGLAPIRIARLQALLWLHTRQGEADVAAWARAAQRARQAGWLRAAVDLLEPAGRAAWAARDGPSSMAAWRARQEICESLGDLVQAGRSIGHQALIAEQTTSPADGLALHLQALRLFERAGDMRLTFLSLVNASRLRRDAGRQDDALRDATRALEIARKGADAGEIALALRTMAAAHAVAGRPAQAVGLLEQAWATAEQADLPLDVALALKDLGTVQQRLGAQARAVTLTQQALALFERLGDELGILETLNNLGTALTALGHTDRARAAFEQALAHARRVGTPVHVAMLVGNLADLAREAGDHEHARALFAEALEASRRLGDEEGVVAATLGLGRTCAAVGEIAEARRHLERAQREAGSLGHATWLLRATQARALLEKQAGEAEACLRAARSGLEILRRVLAGLSEREGSALRFEHPGLYTHGAWAATVLGRSADLYWFVERGRGGGLREMLRGLQSLRDGGLPADLAQDETRARAAVAAAQKAHDRARRSGRLKAARAAARKLESARRIHANVAERVERHLRRTAVFDAEPASLEEVRATLGADEALVLYDHLPEDLVALVVTSVDARIVRLAALKDLIRAVTPLVMDDPAIDVAGKYEAMRRHLVRPLELPATVRRVIVSMSGSLTMLPWSALMSERTVAHTTSATMHVLLTRRTPARGTGVLALGDPAYGTSGARAARFPLLPGTRAEVTAVGDVVLVGEQANEKALRDALRQRARWRAVHLACHGYVDGEEPMHSALALTQAPGEDGRLTLLEIMQMDVPTDLAVLSACMSSRGTIVLGEGVVGPTRSFIYAGARSVLSSLWKVDDEATRTLMVKFYELWNPKEGKGLGAAAALKKAQAYVRSHEKWKHPYYWAAWVLWGLPN